MAIITKTTINYTSIKINTIRNIFNYKDHIILAETWTSWQGSSLDASGKHQVLIPFRVIDRMTNHFENIMIIFKKNLKSLDYENSK